MLPDYYRKKLKLFFTLGMKVLIVLLLLSCIVSSVVIVVDPVNGSDMGSGPYKTIARGKEGVDLAINIKAIKKATGSLLDLQLNPGVYPFNTTISISTFATVRFIATDSVKYFIILIR